MRVFTSSEFFFAAYWARVLFVQSCFVLAFWVASMGVRLLPPDHPLRLYHSYARERIRPIYIKAAAKTR